MVETPGYTLYWEALSGAMAPQVMLEEMAVGYRKVAVDMARGEHKTPEYLAVNPTGQVPALGLPDGTVIGESAAIVLVLGERHPEAGLVPRMGDPDRPVFLRWLVFMAASLYMTFVRYNHPERFTTDQSTTEPIRAAALCAIDRDFGVLGDAIRGDPFFLPRGLTALDIYLTMLASWHPDRQALFNREPRVAALCRAVEARRSYAIVAAQNLPPGAD
jgi:glutathione S-transferase